MKLIPVGLTAALFLATLGPPPGLAAGREDAISVKVIQGPRDVPGAFTSLARQGDLLISDGRNFAVLGATARPIITSVNYPYGQALGSLLGFAPAGSIPAAADLNLGAPVLRLGDKTHHLGYSELKKISSGRAKGAVVFEAKGRFEDKAGRKAEITTTYAFDPGRGGLEITSTLVNTGTMALEEASFSLFIDTYGRFNFSPYEEKRFPGLNYRVFQRQGHFLGWLSFNPVEKAPVRYPGRLLPGASAGLRHVLLAEASGPGLLGRIYDILGLETVPASVSFKNGDGPWLEFAAREVLSSAVFYRAFIKNPDHLEFSLPPGVYRFQANFFPGSAEELVEVGPSGDKSCVLSNPATALVRVGIRDGAGQPVPGKVTFIGLGATRSPYFRPENPVATGRGWESQKNSCFPGIEGLEVELPTGTYLATASRGPEYTIDEKVVEVVKEGGPDLAFLIDRVVETAGLVAFDPHLHTTNSDGSVSVPERIKAVVAEGIEVMAATDHNAVTDYAPALIKLGLESMLTVIPGSEVTVTDVLHYNTYPMQPRPEEPGNGAIRALGEPGQLFKASREKNPQAIIQVNHPRAGDLGYFNNYDLDQKSGATALAGLDTGFDVLEVMNGPFFFASNRTAIEDWFHLLSRGYRFPIVGSSDSHTIDRGEPGYSRTYVYAADDGPAPRDTEALVGAVRRGRSFATNGPVVDLRVNGAAGPGEDCAAPGGRVDIRISVRSAPWIAVDEVRLVLNGERRLVFPVSTPKEEVLKFSQEVGLALERDTFLCVEALGKETMFPVLQTPSRNGSIEGGTAPFAITNPVFVDVDGNGRFDPPLPDKLRPLAETAVRGKKVPRL